VSPSQVWPTVAAGAALAAAAAGGVGRARRTGILVAVLVVYQAAMLRVTAAGPTVRYQHLRTPLEAWRHSPMAGAILGLGVVLGLAVLVRRRAAVAAWLRAALAPWAIAVSLAAVVALAAVPSLDPAAWATEAGTAAVLQLGALALAGLAAASLPPALAARLDAWLDAPPRAGGRDRLAWGLAAFVTVVAALLAVTSYQHHPHIPDEVSYLLQARYFAAGMLTMPAPAVPAAFNLDLMTFEPARWYSPFPPGWPLVLAIGVRIGAPWLVNPVLGGVAVLLVSALFSAMLPRREARLATILFALSPWQLFLAMSFMSHTLSLALALLAALGLVRMERGGGSWWGWLGGAAIGVVSVNRPLEGVAVAVFLGLVSLAVPGRRTRFAPSMALAGGAVLAGLVGLWYNRAITGHPLTFPVMAYFEHTYGPGINDLGFGPNRGLAWRGLDPLPGHGPADVLVNTGLNASAVNVELFGWCAASLLPVILGVLARRPDRAAWLWIGAIVVVTGAHAFYWFSGGPDFGARYWFLIIVPAVALAARGIATLDRAAGGVRATAAALALSVAALAAFVPWRAADKYYGYRGMRPDVRALARREGFGHALVLVRGRRFPDYASAAAYNPPETRADVPIYAWDRDADTRRAVLSAFPDRPVWVLEGPGVTGDVYRIVAGPLTGEARQRLAAEQ
jgi:hypothetical protein